ncbi:hypothetical protein Skr01_31070 [Sphaerisporangium krabiense]|uniref:Uncharacterized protein n=1 Tax=Sphaerisporangium krabiense TaxID=763782 RepID=A0A7W9DNS1_9ACTN|nr:hypothetical protein [Sphaerisporangium krabiense]MBB5625642.1 hypothetical protein [Sphaerisporangium krabiense]GII63022.1 hypothetical protein Skr01_31070 [Sphaerisporangium krabiense]
MARSKRYKLVRVLEDAATVVTATTGLLRHMSGLLRQLVMIVGWLVLLAGSIRLLVDPPPALSPEHFLAPAAGAAAIFQGVIRPWRSPGRRQPAAEEAQE